MPDAEASSRSTFKCMGFLRSAARLVAWALALLVSVAPGPSQAGERFCDFPGEYSDWMDFTFQGRRLSLPALYADDPWAYQNGVEQTGFLGRVRIPDFGPVPFEETKGKIIKGLRDWAQFSITDFLPLDVVVGRRAGSPSVDNYFDLRPKDFEYTESPFDLERITAQATFVDDLFIGRDRNGAVETFISCNLEGSASFPSCTQLLVGSDFDLRLTYERRELYRWKSFVSQSRRLVACSLDRARRQGGLIHGRRPGSMDSLGDRLPPARGDAERGRKA